MTDTASDPWYGHRRTPGYSQWDDNDVVILPRNAKPNNESGAKRYAQDVVEMVEAMWPNDRWFAPEGHGARAGVGKAWHWDELHEGSIWRGSSVDVPNDFKFVEAKYRRDMGALEDELSMHGGQGWQWPILVVYDEGSVPSPGDITSMKDYGTPFYIKGEGGEIEPDDPTPEEPEEEEELVEIPAYPTNPKGNTVKKRLTRVERKLDWLASFLIYMAGGAK